MFATVCEVIVCAQGVFVLWMLVDLVVVKFKKRKPKCTLDMFVSEDGAIIDFNPQKTQNILKSHL